MQSCHVLVTGGSGLIGALCLELLSSKVGSLVSLSRSGLKQEGATSVSCDLRDLNAVKKVIENHSITHIIHTAGMRTSDCKLNPLEAYEINVNGTLNLYEAARTSTSVERIVMTSTAAVYDTQLNVENLDESAEVIALNPYTSTKLCAEGIAESYFHQYGVSSIILRPQIVFGIERRGEGSTVAPSIAMQKALAGEPYHIAFRGRYTYHYARDIAQYHILPLFDPIPVFERFNCPGVTISVSEIVHLLNVFAKEKHKLNDDLITYGGDLHPFAKKTNAEKFLRHYPEASITSFEKAIQGL